VSYHDPDLITCLNCRESYPDWMIHECLDTMTTEELYSHEAQLLGLKEMIAMHLQPFIGKPLTAARLAALRLAAQEVLAKLPTENTTPGTAAAFEAMVAEAVREIFNLNEDDTP
jgi:hypothetical protein